MQKTLPEKYYLHHFQEFLHHVTSHSKHLLRDQDNEFLSLFNELAEDQQCLIVRIFNRTHPYIKTDTLMHYDELKNSRQLLKDLKHYKLIGTLTLGHISPWLACLTKSELMSLENIELQQSIPTPKKTAKKQEWVEWAKTLDPNRWVNSQTANAYVVNHQQDTLEYLLFIYFGHLNAKLNQFSLRDLGVLDTQKTGVANQARFENKSQAISTYRYHRILTNCKLGGNIKVMLATFLDGQWPNIDGTQAQDLYHRSLFYLGHKIVNDKPLDALIVWKNCQDPRAIEKRLRLLYTNGKHETVKFELNHIIDQPTSEGLLIFAQDFLARKFGKKRTSILTDLLKQATPVRLDEAYAGFVEQGLVNHLKLKNAQAFHTENAVWRALFALVFWEVLYLNVIEGRYSEFDRTPTFLKENRFYIEFRQDIEFILASLTSKQALENILTKNFTRYYGQINGEFFWHSELLNWLLLLVRNEDNAKIVRHLRKMTQNYQALRDGYPDLMVIKENAINWVEVKSPKDQLRRNQLITLQSLKSTGFEVSVQTVQWQYNPDQIYSVVDIETTGGAQSNHRITEIGIVKVKNGVVIDRWQTLVNPQRSIPKYITELTGITPAMVVDAPVFSSIADDLLRFLEGSIFVAHNVGFDYPFIRQEFSRLNIAFKSPKLCTVKLARQYFPDLASYSLGKLCVDLNIELSRHHRAMADAEAAAEILIKINEIRKDE